MQAFFVDVLVHTAVIPNNMVLLLAAVAKVAAAT